MRAHSWQAPIVLLALMSFPRTGSAQRGGEGEGSSTSTGARAGELEQLKSELREELKEELKAEIKAELSEEGAAAGGVKQDAWAEEEWKWEEPVKPELNFLEFDGYFRFRYDLFKNLDLKTTYVNTETGNVSGPFAAGFAPPTPLCNLDVGTRQRGMEAQPGFVAGSNSCLNRAGESTTIGGANMRLRLEPVLNVYEDIKIKMQWDILDNIVLGSTPAGFPKSPLTPLIAFSQAQIPPSDGVNALVDSIRLKRAWAEVGTPLGQLRVGRMPSHFGLGILANEGRGIDSDYGDTNDRIMFATKISDFYIVPAYDWVASGPTSATRLNPQGQPFDRDQRDDVDQYILAIAKRDKDQEIKEKLENDELVLNYGTYQVLRFQALDAGDYYAGNDPTAGAGNQKLLNRDAQAWIFSFWFKLLWRKLSIEAEYAGLIGNIGNSAISGGFGAQDIEVGINQHGGAINTEYKFLRDALTVSLLVAAASGDRAPGWGVFPLSNPGVQPGDWDGSQATGEKAKITNFRFDPDFQVDLIFWRQLVGLVTDALVIRPGVQYNITEGFGGRLDFVYSRAWFAESTPSASKPDGGDNNLGLEADAKVFYDSEDGFHAWLQYGLFVPFAGLDRRVTIEGNEVRDLDAKIAQTLRVVFAVTF